MVEHAVSSGAPAEGEKLEAVSAIKRGNFNPCRTCGESLIDEMGHMCPSRNDYVHTITLLRERIADLEDRLELHAYDLKGNRVEKGAGAWDGIACRDETIKVLEQDIEQIKAERDKLAARLETARKALEQMKITADDIWRNQQRSTQSVASGLLDLIVKSVDDALAQISNPSAALEERDRATVKKTAIRILAASVEEEDYDTWLDVVSREFGLEE